MPSEYNLDEIKQKHKIAYQIDLKNDIDYEKNPQNEIKHTKEYLEFVCENGREITADELEVVFGQIEQKQDYIEATMEDSGFYKGCPHKALRRVCYCLSTSPLEDKYDILNIIFKCNVGQYFFVTFFDEYFRQALKKIKAGFFSDFSDEKYNEMHKSPQKKVCYLKFFDKNLLNITLSTNKGDTEENIIMGKYNDQESTSFYVDYKLGKVNIDKQKWKLVNVAKLRNFNYFSINSMLKSNASFFDEKFYIYKVMYAKNNGYIYLRPITLQKGKYKLFLYYTGEVTLEYSKENGDSWEILTDNLNLNEKAELNFRIKMNSEDKLYDFFIAN